jgi:hypothetical protein
MVSCFIEMSTDGIGYLAKTPEKPMAFVVWDSDDVGGDVGQKAPGEQFSIFSTFLIVPLPSPDHADLDRLVRPRGV